MAYADLMNSETEKLIFEEQFDISLSIARREGWHGALFELELTPKVERKKPLDEGDLAALARELGVRIRKVLRSEDIYLRLEPHRYLIWLQKAVADQLEGIALRLAQEIEQPIETPNATLMYRVHVGIALYPFDGGTLERLHHFGHVALLQGQKLDKTVQIFNPESGQQR